MVHLVANVTKPILQGRPKSLLKGYQYGFKMSQGTDSYILEIGDFTKI